MQESKGASGTVEDVALPARGDITLDGPNVEDPSVALWAATVVGNVRTSE